MKSTTERAVAALEMLPEDMREQAVAYLMEQVEKFRMLQDLVAEGLEDAQAGRVSERDFKSCLRQQTR